MRVPFAALPLPRARERTEVERGAPQAVLAIQGALVASRAHRVAGVPSAGSASAEHSLTRPAVVVSQPECGLLVLLVLLGGRGGPSDDEGGGAGTLRARSAEESLSLCKPAARHGGHLVPAHILCAEHVGAVLAEEARGGERFCGLGEGRRPLKAPTDGASRMIHRLGAPGAAELGHVVLTTGP